jgi:acyl carrier protein
MTGEMSKEELTVWVIDLLAQMFELDKSTITLQSNLYTDLDIDSIDAVDLAVKLKQQTGKRLSPEVFKEIRTIEDVVNAILALSVQPEQSTLLPEQST